MTLRVLPFLASCTFCLPLSALTIVTVAESVQAADVACSTSNLSGSTDCLGALDGNDSNSDLGGSFGFNDWTELFKVDSRSGTAGSLTVTGNGQSGQYTITGLAANATYMVALKGGPSYSLYYLGSGQTSFSGTWNTNGLAKGNGTPGPDLSHFTVYQVVGETADPVPDPLATDSGTTTTTTTTTTTSQVRYTDISTTYWASSFIYRLASTNVVSGFPDGEFLPSASLTKAQYAALVTKAFNLPTVREVVNIRNVSQYYWGYSAIQQAYAMGFVNLDSGTFDPEANLTKLDILVRLGQALGYTEVTSGKSVEELLSVFSDADTIPSEYRVMIAALVEKGIIVNYPNVSELNLFSVVTRAEGCAFIYQAMVSLGLVERITSTYIVDVFGDFQQTETTTDTDVIVDDDGDDADDDDGRRQNCNQGIGNGAEGCDPGNSAPRGGSNDEGGRIPGNRP